MTEEPISNHCKHRLSKQPTSERWSGQQYAAPVVHRAQTYDVHSPHLPQCMTYCVRHSPFMGCGRGMPAGGRHSGTGFSSIASDSNEFDSAPYSAPLICPGILDCTWLPSCLLASSLSHVNHISSHLATARLSALLPVKFSQR